MCNQSDRDAKDYQLFLNVIPSLLSVTRNCLKTKTGHAKNGGSQVVNSTGQVKESCLLILSSLNSSGQWSMNHLSLF